MSSAPHPADPQAAATRAPALRVSAGTSDRLADNLLFACRFGTPRRADDDPRQLHVPLSPLRPATDEHWCVPGPVRHGRDGAIGWADDGVLLFGQLELDEGAAGIAAATRAGYDALLAFCAARGAPHLLRIWNYLDAITEGDGDDERYRQFCLGRAEALAGSTHARSDALPAATAIGRVDSVRRLTLAWIAARAPGRPLENPRQTSAWCYPADYGREPPRFVRAMRAPAGLDLPLLVSGTAAIVGHASQHRHAPVAQLEETLANLQALLARAHADDAHLPARFTADSRLRVYLRDPADLPALAAAWQAHGLPEPTWLHGAVCRRELAVEIELAHPGG
jgi:chorismate lyase/3-hydroxybenzoate synthase